jgi:hypothetical protein
VANETRKLRRAQTRSTGLTGKEKRAQLRAPVTPAEVPDVQNPLGPEQLKKTAVRVALILLAFWLVGGLVAAMTPRSPVLFWLALGVPAVATVVVVGVLVWTLRRARSAAQVADVLRKVVTAEDRQAALAELDGKLKKNDPTGVFARAQLELQEDPKKALATLESLDLSKLMAPVADEARSQRAMIHLALGQVNLARQLVDNIELKRAQDSRSRAMLAAISAEAFARSGDAKKALATLELFDPDDAELAQLRPQLLRSAAFAYAHSTKVKELRRVLRQLVKIDVRLLGGFLQGKTHPLLRKEARQAVEQSGMVPTRMQVQRSR